MSEDLTRTNVGCLLLPTAKETELISHDRPEVIERGQGVWFKSFSVNQRQPGCLLRMAGRVDAIDPGLSRERVVSRGAGGTANCANRTAVEGESLSALIAVIKFENLPDPPPTRILLGISNRSWAYSPYCHAPKRIISRHFEELCRRAIVFLNKKITHLTEKLAISISIFRFRGKSPFLPVWLLAIRGQSARNYLVTHFIVYCHITLKTR